MSHGRFATSACFVLLVTACSGEQAPTAIDPSSALGTASVATVNGEPIPESLFRYYVINIQRKNPDELSEPEREQALDELVQVKLLADAGRDAGLPDERTIAAELELQRLQLLARRMALRYLERNPPTDEELREMYERSLSQLAPTEYKLRNILVDTEEEARAAIERLREGADFAALAEELSGGPSSGSGGDLGWQTAASMVQPVGDAVRGMEPGTFSPEPVATDFGFHVLLLEETRQSEAPSIESVRTELATAVEREKLEAYMATLREEAAVTPAASR